MIANELSVDGQNVCDPNPCNHGTCNLNGYDFKCLCKNYVIKLNKINFNYLNISIGSVNFTGLLCDMPFNTVTDPCQSCPCLSGGTCINVPIFNAIPTYACVCPDGKFNQKLMNIL